MVVQHWKPLSKVLAKAFARGQEDRRFRNLKMTLRQSEPICRFRGESFHSSAAMSGSIGHVTGADVVAQFQ